MTGQKERRARKDRQREGEREERGGRREEKSIAFDWPTFFSIEGYFLSEISSTPFLNIM